MTKISTIHFKKSCVDEASLALALQIARESVLEEVREILSNENYKLEEWYSSAERPATLTHFEANQRNMKTRNKIQARIDELIKSNSV